MDYQVTIRGSGGSSNPESKDKERDSERGRRALQDGRLRVAQSPRRFPKPPNVDPHWNGSLGVPTKGAACLVRR
jgi:hypothetical protein